MDKIKLSLGDKIEIELYSDQGEKLDPILISQYEKTLKDGSMVVVQPIHAGGIYPIRRGAKIGIVFEKNKELYTFMAEAAERGLGGRILMLRIIPKSKVVHLQRRRFFRFNAVLNAEYRMFREENAAEEDRGDYIKTITRDISGGGISVLSNEKPIYNWYVEGKVNVGDDIRFKGKIVRSTRINDRGSYAYEMGVEFVYITDIDREKVISFIFHSQRKMLEKGWSTK